MKNNKVTRSYNSLTEKDKVEITKYYKSHSYSDTCKTCKVSSTTLDKIMKEFNLEKHSRSEALKFTHIKNYGSQEKYVEEMNKNIEKTVIERYGKPCYFMTDEFKEKSRETCLEKYNAEHTMKSVKVRNNLSSTFQTRYGNIWPMQN